MYGTIPARRRSVGRSVAPFSLADANHFARSKYSRSCLFYVWPFAFRLAGFGLAKSMLLCAAVINIHHFIVDRYIWRLRRDSNYRVVTGG